MPRGIPLPIPFPSRISPDIDRADAVHLEWPRHFGLIATDEAARRHADARYAELAARFHPAAAGADLDLGVDQMSWYFLFDDLFDGPIGADPTAVEPLIAEMKRVLSIHPEKLLPPAGPPLAHAFHDMWVRCCVGMSVVWRRRAMLHWHEYLDGYVEEARIVAAGRIPEVEDHLRLRRATVGVQPTLDLAERIGYFEVPVALFYSPTMTTMRNIAAEVDALHNDICSLEKERSIGDVHNIMIILQRTRGWTEQHALEASIHMIGRRTLEYSRLESGLADLYDTLDLNEDDRKAGDQYARNALRTVMRGDYDWAEGSGRYDTDRELMPGGGDHGR